VVVEGVETSANWVQLARTIRSGDDAGTADLYASLTEPLRARLSRVVSPDDVDDSLQEVVVIVLEAIRREGLRDPERLAGFVRTIAYRRTVAHIRSRMLQRRFVEDADLVASRDQTPEECAAGKERIEHLAKILRRLSLRDREILDRFYFRDQNAEQICREMHLTGTQFRLFKSRAIARCFDLAHHRPPARVRCKNYLAKPFIME
jgi:RNA polymerase sigma-70 factor (ECF subfamily)